MRRQKLIWFALGAACSALVALLARVLIVPAEEPQLYLIVHDGSLSQDDARNFEEVASSSARLLHECGATAFSVGQPGIDQPRFAFLKITPGDERALQCILEQAPARGHGLRIRALTEREVAAL